MSELPYWPLYVDDELASTHELTNEQMGAFVRLQLILWRSGGYIAAKDLARFSRAGKRWGALAAAILPKLTVSDGLASSAAQLDTLIRTRERRAKAVARAIKAGTASGAARSAGQTSTTSVVGLTAAKPLKSHNTGQLQVNLKPTNQNQKALESKSRQENKESGLPIYDVAVTLLVEKVGIRALAARSQTAKWLGACGNEAELASILEAVKRENLSGHNLVAVVDQRVALIKRIKERGPTLPLGFRPNVVKAKS